MGKSQVPNYFALGIIVLLFYIAVLFIILAKFHLKEQKRELIRPEIEFKDGHKSIFVLCRNERIKDEIFYFFKNLDKTASVDKFGNDLTFNGLNGNDVLKYFASLSGVDLKKAEELTALLKIKLDNEVLSREDVLKIYVTVKAASDVNYVVFNDFFKMESRDFENSFRKLFEYIINSGKYIIYLSCEMMNPKKAFNDCTDVESFAVIPLEFEKITLR